MIDAVLSAAYPAGEPLTVSKLRYYDVKIMEHFRPVIPSAPAGDRNQEYALDDAYVMWAGGSRLRLKASALPLAVIALLLAGGGYILYRMVNATVAASNDQVSAMVLAIIAAVSFTARFIRVWKRLHLSFFRTNTYDVAPEPSDYQRETNDRTMERLGIKEPDGFNIDFETTVRAASHINKACRLSREAREGLKLVAAGDTRHVNGGNWATAYNPSHIAYARLQTLSGWRTVGGLAIILSFFAVIFAAVMLVHALWGEALGAVWMWFIVAPVGLAFAMFCLGAIVGVVSAVARLLAGVPLSEVFDVRLSHPYRVQVRGLNGGWTTVANLRHQAVAVEVYNLIARDLQKRAE